MRFTKPARSANWCKGEPVDPRRVIIIIGDGNDNHSSKTLEQVVEVAQRNLVTVYGISTSTRGSPAKATDNLVRLAEETGGRVEYPLANPYKDINGYLSQPRDEGNYAIQPGTGRIRVGGFVGDFWLGGEHRGGSDHAIHHALYSRNSPAGLGQAVPDD